MASRVQQNIAFLIKQSGMNSSSAAKLLGVSQPTIFRVIKGEREPNLETIEAAAMHFGVTIDALINEDMPATMPESAIGNGRALGRLLPIFPKIGRSFINIQNPRGRQPKEMRAKGLVPHIPLLHTQVPIPKGSEAYQHFYENTGSWMHCPTQHGPKTFCATVNGESMINTGSKPSYDPGDIIFVDPEAQPQPGDRVIAQLEGQPTATFKQYLEEDGRKKLKALNPNWDPQYTDLGDNDTICGVVIGKWVPE